MAFKVTIAGVDRTSYVAMAPSPHVTKKQNERSLAALVLEPGLVPAQYSEIVMYDVDGVTAVFGGVITQCGTAGHPGPGDVLHVTNLTCVDFMLYTDWCFWTKTYAAPVTLKQILTDVIADKLSAYGITLDASQDTGDTFPAQTFTRIKVSDLLRNLGTACAPTRVFRMSPTKALRILVPGTDAAPVAITDASPHCTSFEWAHSTFIPANSVELICGPTGEGIPTQSWIVGTPSTWEVDIQNVIGGWNAGGVFENGTVFRTLSAAGGGGYYYFDPSVGRGTISVGTGAKAAGGTVLTFVYTAIYPFSVFATSGASPIIESQAVDTAQLLRDPAQLEVNGLLAKLNQAGLRDATITTYDNGFLPSQMLSTTLTSREMAAAEFSITQVEAEFTEFQDSGVRLWYYVLAATETLAYQGSYLDQMRAIIGGGSGATAVAGGGGGGSTTVLASPVYMGGSTATAITNPTAKKLIPNASIYVATASFTGRLRVNIRARDAAVGVKAIISDGTTDVATSIVTSQTFTPIDVVVAIVATKTYRVYLQNNAAGDGFCEYASLEAA